MTRNPLRLHPTNLKQVRKAARFALGRLYVSKAAQEAFGLASILEAILRHCATTPGGGDYVTDQRSPEGELRVVTEQLPSTQTTVMLGSESLPPVTVTSYATAVRRGT